MKNMRLHHTSEYGDFSSYNMASKRKAVRMPTRRSELRELSEELSATLLRVKKQVEALNSAETDKNSTTYQLINERLNEFEFQINAIAER